MKTIKELYDEIMASEEMKEELAAAGSDREALEAFLAKHQCSSNREEFLAFVKERSESIRELNPDELSAAAGGINITVIGASLIMPANCALCSVCVQAFTEDNCIEIFE